MRRDADLAGVRAHGRRTRFRACLTYAPAPAGQVADVVLATRAGEGFTKAVAGLVDVLNDVASWTVRAEAIYKEFRSDGHAGVRSASDIHLLELQDVDKSVGYLASKYKVLAAGEGALAGAAGLPGIVADIPALVAIALRTTNEYATYYGFDVSVQSERAFAMSILSAASAPTVSAKQVALANLNKITSMIAQKKTWAEIERVIGVQLIRKVAKALGVRLTKAKLAQAVPIASAALGAGYNAWYISSTAETAYLLYRERFLIRKHGEEVAVRSL
jgi:hypothetical protein